MSTFMCSHCWELMKSLHLVTPVHGETDVSGCSWCPFVALYVGYINAHFVLQFYVCRLLQQLMQRLWNLGTESSGYSAYGDGRATVCEEFASFLSVLRWLACCIWPLPRMQFNYQSGSTWIRSAHGECILKENLKQDKLIFSVAS